jgi:hypothetical protein
MVIPPLAFNIIIEVTICIMSHTLVCQSNLSFGSTYIVFSPGLSLPPRAHSVHRYSSFSEIHRADAHSIAYSSDCQADGVPASHSPTEFSPRVQVFVSNARSPGSSLLRNVYRLGKVGRISCVLM